MELTDSINQASIFLVFVENSLEKKLKRSYQETYKTIIIQELEEQGDLIDEALEDSFYLRRLDAGLFTLQLIVCIMMEACCSGVVSVFAHLLVQSSCFLILYY